MVKRSDNYEKQTTKQLPILYKKEENYLTKRTKAWENSSKPARFLIGGTEIGVIYLGYAAYNTTAIFVKFPFGIFIWGFEDYKGTVKKAFFCFVGIIAAPFKLASNPKNLIEEQKELFKRPFTSTERKAVEEEAKNKGLEEEKNKKTEEEKKKEVQEENEGKVKDKKKEEDKKITEKERFKSLSLKGENEEEKEEDKLKENNEKKKQEENQNTLNKNNDLKNINQNSSWETINDNIEVLVKDERGTRTRIFIGQWLQYNNEAYTITRIEKNKVDYKVKATLTSMRKDRGYPCYNFPVFYNYEKETELKENSLKTKTLQPGESVTINWLGGEKEVYSGYTHNHSFWDGLGSIKIISIEEMVETGKVLLKCIETRFGEFPEEEELQNYPSKYKYMLAEIKPWKTINNDVEVYVRNKNDVLIKIFIGKWYGYDDAYTVTKIEKDEINKKIRVTIASMQKDINGKPIDTSTKDYDYVKEEKLKKNSLQTKILQQGESVNISWLGEEREVYVGYTHNYSLMNGLGSIKIISIEKRDETGSVLLKCIETRYDEYLEEDELQKDPSNHKYMLAKIKKSNKPVWKPIDKNIEVHVKDKLGVPSKIFIGQWWQYGENEAYIVSKIEKDERNKKVKVTIASMQKDIDGEPLNRSTKMYDYVIEEELKKNSLKTKTLQQGEKLNIIWLGEEKEVYSGYEHDYSYRFGYNETISFTSVKIISIEKRDETRSVLLKCIETESYEYPKEEELQNNPSKYKYMLAEIKDLNEPVWKTIDNNVEVYVKGKNDALIKIFIGQWQILDQWWKSEERLFGHGDAYTVIKIEKNRINKKIRVTLANMQQDKDGKPIDIATKEYDYVREEERKEDCDKIETYQPEKKLKINWYGEEKEVYSGYIHHYLYFNGLGSIKITSIKEMMGTRKVLLTGIETTFGKFPEEKELQNDPSGYRYILAEIIESKEPVWKTIDKNIEVTVKEPTKNKPDATARISIGTQGKNKSGEVARITKIEKDEINKKVRVTFEIELKDKNDEPHKTFENVYDCVEEEGLSEEKKLIEEELDEDEDLWKSKLYN